MSETIEDVCVENGAVGKKVGIFKKTWKWAKDITPYIAAGAVIGVVVVVGYGYFMKDDAAKEVVSDF